MSMLYRSRVRIAFGLFGAFVLSASVPVEAGASACGVLSNSFRCMTGVKKSKKTLATRAGIRKKSATGYKVAAIRPTARISDASPAVAVPGPARKQVRKARRKTRHIRKLHKSARYLRNRRSLRHNRRVRRKNRALRTIGRRLDARSVRNLATPASRRKTGAGKTSRKSVSKRGWRTRSRRLGYSVAGRGIRTSCFPARLRKLLRQVSAHYGRRLIITSGYRSHRHNRRIGGARRSQHLHCMAADFYIPGVNKYTLARYLKRLPGRGGVGTYAGNRTVHLDVGPRRSWHWGRKRRHARRHKARRHYRSRRSVRRRHVARVIRFRGAKG